MIFYTYILFSSKKGRFYTGYTENTPNERLDQHNNGMSPSTRSGVPWKLVFYKSFKTKSEAIKFEKFIKRQKSSKFIKTLIKSVDNELRE